MKGLIIAIILLLSSTAGAQTNFPFFVIDECNRLCFPHFKKLSAEKITDRGYLLGSIQGIDERMTMTHGHFSIVKEKIFLSEESTKISTSTSYGLLFFNLLNYLSEKISYEKDKTIFAKIKVISLLTDIIDKESIEKITKEIAYTKVLDFFDFDSFINVYNNMNFYIKAKEPDLNDFCSFIIELLFKEQEIKYFLNCNINFYNKIKRDFLIALANNDKRKLDEILRNERIDKITRHYLLFCSLIQ